MPIAAVELPSVCYPPQDASSIPAQPCVRLLGVASALGGPTSETTGAAEAPDALRALGLLESVRACDCRAGWSDDLLPPLPGERWSLLGRLLPQVADALQATVAAGCKPLLIGGDHSLAAGSWRGVGRALGSAPGLLWIDTHLDAHTPDSSPSGNPHGMPLAALFGHGDRLLTDIPGPTLDPRYVAVLGAHSWEPEERALLRGLGVRVFDMEEIRRYGLATCLHQALARVAAAPAGFGLSIDVDAIDPSEAPGVSTPVGQGLHADDLLPLLHGLLRRPDCVAAEIVEYAPNHDIDRRTGRLVVHLVEHLLAPTDPCEKSY